MVKAVIFDMDGVIVDTEPIYYKSWQRSLENIGYNYTQELHNSIKGGTEDEVVRKIKSKLSIGDDITCNDLINLRNVFFEKMFFQELKIIEGLYSLLDFIKHRNLKCAVVTGSRKIYMESIFSRLGIGGRFDYILSGDEMKVGKPDPWVYRSAVENLNLKACECIVLEDSLNGVKSAINAGCRVMVVNSDLKNLHDSHVISYEKDLFGVEDKLKYEI